MSTQQQAQRSMTTNFLEKVREMIRRGETVQPGIVGNLLMDLAAERAELVEENERLTRACQEVYRRTGITALGDALRNEVTRNGPPKEKR